MDGSEAARAGWYVDPYRAATLRWWDGGAWTGHIYGAPPSPLAHWLRRLPWIPWMVSFGLTGILGLICFGMGESTKTPNPSAWYAAGFISVAVVVVVSSAWTLTHRQWRAVALFAVLVASVVALAIFTVTAPSTSRSCANNGQPRSAGTYDCDTSFGIGGPIVLAVFFVPAFALSSVGKGLGITVSKLHRPS